MNFIWLLNFIILVLFIWFVFYAFTLYFKDVRRRRDLKAYLADTQMMTPSDRERIAHELTDEEAAGKRSSQSFLTMTLIVMVVSCILLLFSQTERSFGIVLILFLACVFLIWFGYRMYVAYRNRKIVDQLPSAIELILHYTLSNVALIQSIKLVAEQAPKPLANFFKEADRRINGGQTLAEALRHAARPYKIFELNYFVMIMVLQQETGADTIKILRRLIDFLRREKIMQQRIRAIKADMNAVQYGLPVLILIMAFGTWYFKPEYIDALLSSRLGVQLLLLAIFMFILGVWLIQRVTRVI